MGEINIDVNYLARVEGRGALNIRIAKDGKVKDLKFRIYEPPRFFESFLIGRRYDELMELTSRICGICPVAHQITALRAVENALEVEPSQQTKDLRKLLAISAHIQSNVLSMYFLSLPDLMGYESIIPMTKDHLYIVKRGLKLKKLGNDITDLIGGRAVHPVTAVVNGFTALPSKNKLQVIRKRLKEAKQDAYDTVDLFSEIEIPDFKRKCEHMAISDPKEYAINRGRFKSTEGLNVDEIISLKSKNHTPPHFIHMLKTEILLWSGHSRESTSISINSHLMQKTQQREAVLSSLISIPLYHILHGQ